MESIWLCSRNDIVANGEVFLTGIGVSVTDSMWPDSAVGVMIAVILLRLVFYVVTQTLRELRRQEAALQEE